MVADKSRTTVIGYPLPRQPPLSTNIKNANAANAYAAPPRNHAATTYPPFQGSYSSSTANHPTSFNIANPEPNSNANNKRRSSNIIHDTICPCFSAFIIVGIIATFIVWSILSVGGPNLPQVVRVGNLNLSNFNATTMSWETRIKVRNPNSGLTMNFDHIQASVNYISDQISVTTLPPFVLGSKNETMVRAESALKFVGSGSGMFMFDDFWVGMTAKVHYRYHHSWLPRGKGSISVFCPRSTVLVSSAGTGGSFVGRWAECDVNWD